MTNTDPEHIAITDLADHAANTIRALTHRTRPGITDLTQPSEAAQIIAALATMASTLPQLLDQLTGWLEHEHSGGHLRVDANAPLPDASQTVHTLTGSLERAIEHTHRAAAELDTAHQHTAHLASPRGQNSCRTVGPNHLTKPRLRFERSQRSGQWEVSYVPDATIRAFSRRGDAASRRCSPSSVWTRGRRPCAGSAGQAKGRQAKDGTHLSDAELRASWRAQASEAGIDPDQVLAQVRREGSPDAESDAGRLAVVLGRVLHPELGLTGHRRRFTTAEALAAVADALPDGAADVADIERLTRVALEAAGVVPLGGVVVHGRDSARQLGAAHMRNAQRSTPPPTSSRPSRSSCNARLPRPPLVDERSSPSARSRPRSTSSKTGRGFRLSPEQRAIATALATSGRDVEYLIGPPAPARPPCCARPGPRGRGRRVPRRQGCHRRRGRAEPRRGVRDLRSGPTTRTSSR